MHISPLINIALIGNFNLVQSFGVESCHLSEKQQQRVERKGASSELLFVSFQTFFLKGSRAYSQNRIGKSLQLRPHKHSDISQSLIPPRI